MKLENILITLLFWLEFITIYEIAKFATPSAFIGVIIAIIIIDIIIVDINK